MSQLVPLIYIMRLRFLLALTYRFEVFTAVLANLVLLLTSIFLWQTAYDQIDSVKGVQESQMLRYAVWASVLTLFFSTNISQELVQRIRLGQVAVDLMRPIPPLALWLSEDLGNAFSSVLIRALPLLAVGWFLIGDLGPEHPQMLPFFLVSALLAFLVNWLIAALVTMIAFWVLELGSFPVVTQTIIYFLSGGMVPLWFYPESFERICQYLPFIHVYQTPLSIYVGKLSAEAVPLACLQQLGWCLLLGFLLTAAWHRASQRVLVQGG